MKKKSIINLIRYHMEGNDIGFRTEAYEIAKEFDTSGDNQLSEYIMALLSNANTFVPQDDNNNICYLEKTQLNNDPLPLPEVITNDIMGIVNAVSRNVGVNKFLFEGKPGTGKTESAKQLSRILNKELYLVNFSVMVDSKLGQTQKNIVSLFDEINSFTQKDKVMILFDEIDALALDRNNVNDLREMGRVTSSLFKELEKVDERIIIVATTNLFKYLDKALIRRFDAIINFDRYNMEDLLEIANIILNDYLEKFKIIGRNTRLFNKIIMLMNPILSPAELKNLIKTSIAFSNVDNNLDYLKKIYYKITSNASSDIKVLKEQGFTMREIEILTGVSRSSISRDLREM